MTANHAVLDGGLYEVPCEVVLEGRDRDTCEGVIITCPTSFYDADVRVDALLSYEWLRQYDVDVRCRRRGLEFWRWRDPREGKNYEERWERVRAPVWVAGVDAAKIGGEGRCRGSRRQTRHEASGCVWEASGTPK